MACPGALLSVARTGAIAYHHRRDTSFDMDALLAQWRLSGLDAKEIFFRFATFCEKALKNKQVC